MSLSFPTMASIRFGYGIRPGEEPPRTVEAMLSQLSATPGTLFPYGGIENGRLLLLQLFEERRLYLRSKMAGKPVVDRKALTQKTVSNLMLNQMLRVKQAVQSPLGFQERIASFWLDHFSVSTRKAAIMPQLVPIYEAEAIRPHLGGTFRELLHAAVLHPAMLVYLDQTQSVGPNSAAAGSGKRGLNENLGRELLELHTLGADGSYHQSDVRSAAIVLTGLTIDHKTMTMAFMPRLAQPGGVSVLGKPYAGKSQGVGKVIALLDDLASNPDTAHHICRKLAAHFISDDPPEILTRAMISEWQASGGNLTTVYQTMLSHPRAWSDPGMKIKQPFEYIVSGLRAFGVTENSFWGPIDPAISSMEPPVGMVGDTGEPASSMQADGDFAKDEMSNSAVKKQRSRVQALTVATLRTMGQPVWQPPSPAGFSDDVATWLSAGQLSSRIVWARRLAQELGAKMEPRELLRAVLGDAARQDTITVVGQAPNKQHAITMILASPEFNRR